MDETFFYELKMEHKSWREGFLHMQLSAVKKGTDVSSSVMALLAGIKLFGDLQQECPNHFHVLKAWLPRCSCL
jgi:hypothetical protein